jgi:tetratricopeptide (TPR) repeat protein
LLARDTAAAQDRTWKECELANHDPDRSIAACSKLLTRPSSRVHAAAFHNRGLAFAAKGNLDQAISDVSQGIRLDPQRAYRWQERGELYTRQGKYQQAIADITEAIRRDSTPRAFRFHSRGEAYRGLGDLPRAIADFTEAIRVAPEARSFRYHDRGNALRDVGQHISALGDYEIALKMAPTDVWVLVDRGRTYVRMGRSQAARSDFDTALKLDPSSEELRRVVEVELAAITAPSAVSPGSPPSVQPPKEAAPAPPQDKEKKEISSGSAFVVSRKGHLLTNDHVISNPSSTVRFTK